MLTIANFLQKEYIPYNKRFETDQPWWYNRELRAFDWKRLLWTGVGRVHVVIHLLSWLDPHSYIMATYLTLIYLQVQTVD